MEPGTPASWQPDPTGRHDYRYWDGERWTDNASDAGETLVDRYEVTAAPDEHEQPIPEPVRPRAQEADDLVAPAPLRVRLGAPALALALGVIALLVVVAILASL